MAESALIKPFSNRLLTSGPEVMLQGKYGNLDASVISYGPCQTPTLTFAVQRHQVITAFQPEDYWSVRPHIAKHGQRYCLRRPVLVSFAAGKLKYPGTLASSCSAPRRPRAYQFYFT